MTLGSRYRRSSIPYGFRVEYCCLLPSLKATCVLRIAGFTRGSCLQAEGLDQFYVYKHETKNVTHKPQCYLQK